MGHYAEPIKVKTREGVPSAPPTFVRVQPIDSSVVRVWWSPPDPQKINGINQGYKLQAWIGDPDIVHSQVRSQVPIGTYLLSRIFCYHHFFEGSLRENP